MTLEALTRGKKTGHHQKDDPPGNTPVSQLVEETGISDCTLYIWRKEARMKGLVCRGMVRMRRTGSPATSFL